MAPRPVKKRAYRSTVRQEQAARTRARIVDAAGELFEANGYARTTIRDIAGAAGVAPDTVYATFGSKIRVLTAIIDARLAPAGEANVLDRPEIARLRDERDPRRQLELFARDITTILNRLGGIYEILRTAGAVEPDAANVYAEMNEYRLRNMRNFASWVAATGRLRVDTDRAAEIIWALASPDVARLLREVRGWSDEQYTQWLGDSLVRTLLDDGGRGEGRRSRRRPSSE